jgi:hypothetical protein
VEGSLTEGSFASLSYYLDYFPALDWPSDIPQGISTPSGYEVLCDARYDPERILNSDGDYGSFDFYIVGITQAEIDDYFDGLIRNDWKESWLMGDCEKEILWDGNIWLCYIGYSHEYQGVSMFSVAFHKQ